MKVRDVFSFSGSAIRLRKLRAGLTTLGIVIGITAIVALLSITQGLQSSITSQFEEGFASDTVVVTAGGGFSIPGLGPDSDFTLLKSDLDLVSEIDHVELAIATMSKQSSINFTEAELQLTVTGVDYANYATFYNTFVLSENDIPTNPSMNDVVIGSNLVDPWNNDTIIAEVGESITITYTTVVNGSRTEANYSGTVVAVLDEIGTFGAGPSDSGIYIPLEQAMNFFDTTEVNQIIVKVRSNGDGTVDEATIDQVSQDIEELFEGEVRVTSATSLLDTISTMLSTVESFLVIIAGISLLVAGVGIMNIMIVSLMERTREIGILKALGMKSRTVLGIFLSEAMMVGLLGAFIGVVTGFFVSNLFSGLLGGMGAMGPGGRPGAAFGSMSITPVLTLDVVFMAVTFGILVSVLFGLYPAWRASRLHPVDALRHE